MKHKILNLYYNKFGYEVYYNGKLIYSAGTHPKDLEYDGFSTIKHILKLARITAGDFAEHYKLKCNQIIFEYKEDLP
jgi:hypothetical protein